MKPATAFRPRRMICKDCVNGDLCTAKNLEKGEDKPCDLCGQVFRAALRNGALLKFCGRSCANAAMIRSPDAPCLNCGEVIRKKKFSNGSERYFCSLKCRTAYRIGPNNPGWKGGLHTLTGEIHAYVGHRRGFIGTSWAVHRIIASASIGRQLTKNEYVIHIDGKNANNVPSNLFVCESQSEYRRRRIGNTLPWPTTSNLDTYGQLPLVDETVFTGP